MKIQSIMLEHPLEKTFGVFQYLRPPCSTVEFTMTGSKRVPFASVMLAVGKAVGFGYQSSRRTTAVFALEDSAK
jgi:hypothetical protein